MSTKDCTLTIKVVANASRTEIAGWLGESLKIRVRAAPEDGKANRALIRFLSGKLGCARSQIVLESGEFSPQKRIRTVGINRSQLLTLLNFQKAHE